MRKTIRQQVLASTNKRLLHVDFHDFLQKQAYLEDLELATEFALTSQELQHLRAKLQR